MVLIMITHVEGQPIDWPIITVGLLFRIIRIMFLDPTRAHRVQPNGEEKRKRQVKKSWPAAEINNRYIVRDGAREIHEEPSVPHGDRFQAWGPRELKKWEQHQPNGLAIPFIADQARLPMISQIGIMSIVALMRVMPQMINTKTHRARIQIREIGQDRNQLGQ